MINVYYDECANPIPDKQARRKAMELVDIINNNNMEWDLTVSNESYINAIRELVAKGIVSCKNVKFFHKKIEIKVNEYGRLDPWPRGFADENLDMAENILRLAIKKRKESRE